MPNFYNIMRARKFSTAADTALEIAPYNSATPNFTIEAGGKLKWSSGSANHDTTLYRSAANTLKTDDSFDVASGHTYKIDGADVLTATSLGSSITSSSLTSVGTLTSLSAANPTFTGTVSGITKTMVGLGSVDNTSDASKPVSTAQQTALNLKANLASPTFTGTVTIPSGASISGYAPLASPTFTGTVSGITKTMVGLGSVDNTSDASKPVSTAQQTALDLKANLASPTFTGTVTVNGTTSIQQLQEKVTDATISTNVLTSDYSTGSIFYTSATANFTLNITNLPTNNGNALTVTVVVSQGGTAGYPNVLQVAGSAQTIKWPNGNTVPSPNINKIDIFTFTLIRRSSAWTVLGSYSLNY
jgi:hypothetical protein